MEVFATTDQSDDDESVTAPNGLIAHMFGSIEGKRHDAFMLSVSGLPCKLQPLVAPSGSPYVLYGDPAYGLSRNIISPFRGAQEQEFNRDMSAVRIAVEWSFERILKYFSYLDFWKTRHTSSQSNSMTDSFEVRLSFGDNQV